MNKETLRMQMLAGVITESQYKQRLNEGRNMDELENLVQNNFQTIKDNFIKSELENLEDIEFDEDWEKEDAIEDLHDQMDVSEAIYFKVYIIPPQFFLPARILNYELF